MEKTVSAEVARSTRKWAFLDGVDIEFTRENIEGGVEWSIQDRRHSVIVHLAGRMTELETELDGCSMSVAPANVEEVWIVPAGYRYASRARGGDIEYAVITLHEDFMIRLFSGLPSLETLSPMQGVRDPFCYWAMREFMQATACDADDVSAMLADSVLRSLCLHLYRAYGCAPAREPTHPQFDSARIKALRTYIHNKLAERITVAELQAMVGMNSEAFLSGFRRAFGATPGRYVIEQRIRRAQWLLIHSAASITEIACSTGFSSHAHLSRTFKQHVGQSPSVYRDHHI
ncbi:helix-turn-helix domain-containing protein [Parahaliea mediterranea]|uniref:helix-turn-helix domain-containing protein n=1 Tax=Parahaliea mediterranea TaxID=651086 RepID=UPI0019D44323|nr:AraC family transcriptional regulator [Parahaliea mediterranea]